MTDTAQSTPYVGRSLRRREERENIAFFNIVLVCSIRIDPIYVGYSIAARDRLAGTHRTRTLTSSVSTGTPRAIFTWIGQQG